VRFSVGKQNTVEDIERAILVLPDIVHRLREATGFYSTTPEMVSR
jgi:cysteine sulfinate desulfinase/cysteine desulfurase-like protein